MLPVLSVLTKDEVLKIHEASLEVLEKTGVLLGHPGAQEKLAALGARISDDRTRVFMPRAFIDKMLKLAPTSTDTQSHQAMFHYGSAQAMATLMQVTEQGGAGSVQAAAFYSHQAMALILDWRQLPNWEEKPDTVVERAEAKVREILARPKPEPLAPEVSRELDRIMAAAEKEFN